MGYSRPTTARSRDPGVQCHHKFSMMMQYLVWHCQVHASRIDLPYVGYVCVVITFSSALRKSQRVNNIHNLDNTRCNTYIISFNTPAGNAYWKCQYTWPGERAMYWVAKMYCKEIHNIACIIMSGSMCNTFWRLNTSPVPGRNVYLQTIWSSRYQYVLLGLNQ